MEELFSHLMPYLLRIGTLYASVQVVWSLFDKAEKVVTSQTRCDVSRWLRQVDPVNTTEHWPRTFIAIFDSVFGEHHLSWRCIWRSCAASLIGVAILTLVWASFHPDEAFYFFATFDVAGGLLILGLWAVMFNLVPDYLSLLETRYVLRWMGPKPSALRVCALLAFDVIATGTIFLCTMTLVLMFFEAGSLFEPGSIIESINEMWELLAPGLLLSTNPPSWPFGKSFFSFLWHLFLLYLLHLSLDVALCVVRRCTHTGKKIPWSCVALYSTPP